MRKRGSQKSTRDKGVSERETLIAFHLLAEACVGLYHSLKAAAEHFHGEEELSNPERGVLMSLHRKGSQTVPQIARVRQFSRQHILNVSNQLVHEGYIEQIENPDHKRSSLLRLTAKGESLVEKLNKRETEILSQFELGVENKDMLQASEVLNSLKKAFKGRQWKELVKKFDRQTKRR